MPVLDQLIDDSPNRYALYTHVMKYLQIGIAKVSVFLSILLYTERSPLNRIFPKEIDSLAQFVK